MNAPVENLPFAWQPFTPRGVAAFARASLGRLLLMQFVVAVFASATAVWFVRAEWFPVIRTAISHLPPHGRIFSGKLEWQAETPASLAEGRCLAFTVDLNHQGKRRSPADFQVEFGNADLKVFSLFGFIQYPYPPALTFPFNQPELEPWWGAWAPPILAIVAGTVLAGLLLTWALLASAYSVPVWLLAFFADRDLSFVGSWRLAGAALMPGALLLSCALLLYRLGTLGLIELLVAAAAHWVAGWVYAVLGALSTPQRSIIAGEKGNPFA
jgi:hypothetical protein